MATRGRLVDGYWNPVPAEKEIVPSAADLYQYVGKLTATMNPDEEDMVANVLWNELKGKGYAVIGVEALSDSVRVQVVGVQPLSSETTVGPLSITLIALAIAGILAAIGWIISVFSFSSFAGSLPPWLWGVLLLSGAAALIIYMLAQLRKASPSRVYGGGGGYY